MSKDPDRWNARVVQHGATGAADIKERRDEMVNSKKVGDRLSDNSDHREYWKVLSLAEARVWMRVRARGIKGVKMNCKSSFATLAVGTAGPWIRRLRSLRSTWKFAWQQPMREGAWTCRQT